MDKWLVTVIPRI